jgi:hypothetical protein
MGLRGASGQLDARTVEEPNAARSPAGAGLVPTPVARRSRHRAPPGWVGTAAGLVLAVGLTAQAQPEETERSSEARAIAEALERLQNDPAAREEALRGLEEGRRMTELFERAQRRRDLERNAVRLLTVLASAGGLLVLYVAGRRRDRRAWPRVLESLLGAIPPNELLRVAEAVLAGAGIRLGDKGVRFGTGLAGSAGADRVEVYVARETVAMPRDVFLSALAEAAEGACQDGRRRKALTPNELESLRSVVVHLRAEARGGLAPRSIASPVDARGGSGPTSAPSDDWRPAVRALLYGVQFEPDPLQAVDRTLRAVVDRGTLDLARDDYREAVVQALGSHDSLAQLIPQGHSEETVRRFLRALQRRLLEPEVTPDESARKGEGP